MSKKRTEDLSRIAFDMKIAFQEKDHWNLHTLLEDFKLFRYGGRKEIKNLMYHSDPMMNSEVYIFDYRFVISTGKSSKAYNQTVFFVHSKKLGLPFFRMRPENFFHKIGSWLGIDDIDFEEYPEFSKQYYLKSDDEDYIRYMMNDEILKFFSIEKKWFLEGINYYLIFYRRDKLMNPGQIKKFYQKGMHLFELFRDQSWQVE
jgi:hypothetical protein